MLEEIQGYVRVVSAFLLGIWAGMPQVTQLLLIVMAADVALGTYIAWKDGRWNTDVAREGAGKKIATLVMVGLAAVLTPYAIDLIGVNLVQAASAFYLVPELGSVTKNGARLGAPTFPQLEQLLAHFESTNRDKGKEIAGKVEGKVEGKG